MQRKNSRRRVKPPTVGHIQLLTRLRTVDPVGYGAIMRTVRRCLVTRDMASIATKDRSRAAHLCTRSALASSR